MDTSSHPSVEHQGQLDYNVTGTRIVAALIYFIPLVILFIVMAALSGDSSAEGGSVGVSLFGLPALLFFLLALAYYAVSVGLTGTTLGKRLMGLKVVMPGWQTIWLGTLPRTQLAASRRWSAGALRSRPRIHCNYAKQAPLGGLSGRHCCC